MWVVKPSSAFVLRTPIASKCPLMSKTVVQIVWSLPTKLDQAFPRSHTSRSWDPHPLSAECTTTDQYPKDPWGQGALHNTFNRKLNKLVISGAIESALDMSTLGFCVHFFMVPERYGSFRLAIDLKCLDGYIVIPSFFNTISFNSLRPSDAYMRQ